MAEELELGRSTTHRYATTLVTPRLSRAGAFAQYRLSSRVSTFGLSLLDSMAVRRLARRHLSELRALTGRTVGLAMLDGTEIVYIDRWQGSRWGSMPSTSAWVWGRACPHTAPPPARRSWRACRRRSSVSCSPS
jgi:DNA-binding IclR family transcriptional regulator